LEAALDLLNRPGNAVRSALVHGPEAFLPGLEGQVRTDGTELPIARDLPDQGFSLGPLNVTPRTVAGMAESVATDPLTYAGGFIGKGVGAALHGLGGLGGLADLAPDLGEGAARLGKLDLGIRPMSEADLALATHGASMPSGTVSSKFLTPDGLSDQMRQYGEAPLADARWQAKDALSAASEAGPSGEPASDVIDLDGLHKSWVSLRDAGHPDAAAAGQQVADVLAGHGWQTPEITDFLRSGPNGPDGLGAGAADAGDAIGKPKPLGSQYDQLRRQDGLLGQLRMGKEMGLSPQDSMDWRNLDRNIRSVPVRIEDPEAGYSSVKTPDEEPVERGLTDLGSKSRTTTLGPENDTTPAGDQKVAGLRDRQAGYQQQLSELQANYDNARQWLDYTAESGGAGASSEATGRAVSRQQIQSYVEGLQRQIADLQGQLNGGRESARAGFLDASSRGLNKAADDYQAMRELTPEDVDAAQNNLLSNRIRSVTPDRAGLLQRYPTLIDRSNGAADRAGTIQNARNFVFNDSSMGQKAQQRAVEDAAIAKSREISMERDPIARFSNAGVSSGADTDEQLIPAQLAQGTSEESLPHFGGASIDRTSAGTVGTEGGRATFQDLIAGRANPQNLSPDELALIRANATADAEARQADLAGMNELDPLYPRPGQLTGSSPIDSLDSTLANLLMRGQAAGAPYLRRPSSFGLGNVGDMDNNVRDFIASELIDKMSNSPTVTGNAVTQVSPLAQDLLLRQALQGGAMDAARHAGMVSLPNNVGYMQYLRDIMAREAAEAAAKRG
jgi:hypothetical protein